MHRDPENLHISASEPPLRGVLYQEETKNQGYRKISQLRFFFLEEINEKVFDKILNLTKIGIPRLATGEVLK